MVVWDFRDSSYYQGKGNPTIEDAKAKLKEQKQKLSQIRKQLETLRNL